MPNDDEKQGPGAGEGNGKISRHAGHEHDFDDDTDELRITRPGRANPQVEHSEDQKIADAGGSGHDPFDDLEIEVDESELNAELGGAPAAHERFGQDD